MTYTHAYLGRARCGHVIMIATDDGAKSNATEVASVMRRGGTVERMPIDAARQVLLAEMCKCSKADRWKVPA